MLVFRPNQFLMKYKGYDVVIKSDSQTEDSTKFDRIATELRVILIDALGAKHENH